jgi:ubiquinone biosynthesis protein
VFFKKIKKWIRGNYILWTIVGNGILYLLEKIKIELKRLHQIEKRKLTRKLQGKYLYFTVEKLGPVFIKFAQIATTRPDIFSAEFVETLSVIQDTLPPVGFNKIKPIIEEELQSPIDEVFTYFNTTPIASASLAEVYEAKIKEEEVIVKVKKPKVEEVIKIDIEILKFMVKIFKKRVQFYEPLTLLEEFEKILWGEMNFVTEALNIERFRDNFKEEKEIALPKVYWDYTTSNLLTLSYIKGVKITDIERLSNLKINTKEVVQKGAKIILKQILIDGFFHADPHPGNVLITKEGKLGFVDFGIVGRIDPYTRKLLQELMSAYITMDGKKIIKIMKELGAIKIEEKKLYWELYELIDKYKGTPLGKISIKEAGREWFSFLRKYKITLPRNLVLLEKTLVEIEGIGKQLYPEFNFVEFAHPIVKEMVKKEWIRFSKDIILEYLNLLQHFPKDVREIIYSLKKGEFKIKLQLPEIEKEIEKVAIEMKKTKIGIGVSILVVGSILLWYQNFIIGGIVTGVGLIFLLFSWKKL